MIVIVFQEGKRKKKKEKAKAKLGMQEAMK
jgi:hypothetical protein